jgi:hypothetical protein
MMLKKAKKSYRIGPSHNNANRKRKPWQNSWRVWRNGVGGWQLLAIACIMPFMTKKNDTLFSYFNFNYK